MYITIPYEKTPLSAWSRSHFSSVHVSSTYIFFTYVYNDIYICDNTVWEIFPFPPGPELIFVSAISSSLIDSLYRYCLLRYASVAHIHIHTHTRALTLVGAMSMSSSLVDSLCRYCTSRYHRVTQTHTHTHTHTCSLPSVQCYRVAKMHRIL